MVPQMWIRGGMVARGATATNVVAKVQSKGE
jgi:hypothetical protein